MNIDQATQSLGVTRQELIDYVGQGIIRYEEVPNNDGTSMVHIEYSDIDIDILLNIMKEQAERRHHILEMIMPSPPSVEDGMDDIDGMVEELGSAINSTQTTMVELQSTTKVSGRGNVVHAVLKSSERIRRAAQNILNTIESMVGSEPPVDKVENGKIRAREKALHTMLQDALPDFQSQVTIVLPMSEKKTKDAAGAWADVKGWFEVVRSGVFVEVKKEEKKKEEEENGKENR